MRKLAISKAAIPLSIVAVLLILPVYTSRAQAVDSTLARRFQLADNYFRAGQFERAINLLEDLYDASPNTYVFFDRLKEAYEGVKRYDDAIRLVDDKLEQVPNNPLFLTEKARLLYLKGDEAQAFAIWDEAIELAPDNRNTYRAVYQTLFNVRLLDRAIEVLERGTRELGPNARFESDLAYLYNLTGRHEEAMQAYLDLLIQNPRQVNYVRGRLGRFIEQEEALQAALTVTERVVRKEPLNRAIREILAWLYMEAGDYQRALDTNRAIDRLEKENGRVLYTFAAAAADASAFEIALEAYNDILKLYPDSPIAAEAMLGVGIMHEEWAQKIGERPRDEQSQGSTATHYEQAIATYRAFIEKYPGSPYYPEVLRRIGNLQRDVFFELGEAEKTLQQVVTQYASSRQTSDEAEFDLGRIALLRNNLDEARLIFSRLADRLRTGELAERARFELALIHFYQGEFDAARTLAGVLDQNTSTDVANDAIELKILLFENRGPDSLDTPLRQFARSHLLERQRKYKEAKEILDHLLAQYTGHALADDVRYLRADILRKIGRPSDAYQAFAEIPLMHPESFLADKSLFMMGQVLEYDLDEKDKAIEAYARLLAEYPGSLLAPEARARIRSLRGDGV